MYLCMLGCVLFSGSIGLHSYVCTVVASPMSGSSVNFTNTTITPAGCKFHILVVTYL